MKNPKTDSFQIYDWLAKDEEDEFDFPDDDNAENAENTENESGITQRYVAYVFAKSKQKKNVCIKVNGYTPFFWIELPDNWKKSWTFPLFEQLKARLPKKMKNEIVDNLDRAVRLKYKFRDYQWNKPKKFMQLVFKSETALRRVYYALKDPITFLPANLRKHQFPIYEKNITPILRLIHLRKLKPAGFVRLENARQINSRMAATDFELNYEVFWKNIHPVEEDSIGALKIASFDIECDSSHGDFPIAIKDYNKLAQNIGDEYRRIKSKNGAVTPALIKQWLNCAFRDYSEKDFDVSQKSSIQTIFLKSKDTYKYITNKLLDTISFKVHTELMKNNKSKETVEKVVAILNEFLPKVEGDKVIQIGTVMYEYGNEKSSIKRHVITLRGCDPILGCEVVACDTVKQVFVEWCKMMKREQPNILTGYNINGFDFKFMWDCAKEYDCLHLLKQLGPLKNQECALVEKELFSAALGHNFLYYFDMPGIVVIDLLKVIQKDHSLTSYKLDSVSNDFIFGSVVEIERLENNSGKNVKLTTPTTFSLEVGNYIVLYNQTIVGNEFIGNEKGEKRKIIHIYENKSVIVEGIENDSLLTCSKTKLFWSVGKDDVSPQDIFEKQNGSDADRALVAKYCVQDCELCLNLMQKLEIIANNIGMSNVCLVPFSFLFLRGQMIKTLSLVSSECLKESYLLPELPRPNEDVKDSYEGAIVLDPTPGIYLDDPVAVLDYSSLYPSSMIGSNISHDTIITEAIYQGDSGAELLRKRGIEFEDVSFDNYYMRLEGKTWKKHIFDNEPVKTCRYLQPPKNPNGEIDDTKRGILPRILMKLLKARKNTRKLIKTEKDPFRCAVLDGLQLAYKVTANSLYGGVGAAVSALYYKEIAASTTAVGRNHLYLARDFCKKTYPQCNVVYGDTDSVFVNFKPTDEFGNKLTGTAALEKTIEMAVNVEKKIQPFLAKPHCLEYEKTFAPFIQLSKKRYCGNKYETDVTKFKFTSMGIVLKRRDNAPIVKYIYEGIIKRIMNDRDIDAAITFTFETIDKILRGGFPIQYFIITKKLNAVYANPTRIVHKVLADRMAERDPGNKPQSNDRIPFAYVKTKTVPKLQGDRVEHPDYIKAHNLKLDFLFYITNQISKPVSQLFGLALENLRPFGFNLSNDHFDKLARMYRKEKMCESEINDKIMTIKQKEAYDVIFSKRVKIENGRRYGQTSITSYFGLK